MPDRRDPQLNPPPGRPEDAPAPDDTQTLVSSMFQLQAGTMIGERYRIVRLLGMGGMGKVYQAHDLVLEQEVALKIIRPELLQEEGASERFKRELLLARKVSHRNVVRIHDIGQFEGLEYLSMSLVEGKSLREALRSDGPLEPERAEAVFRQICEAVAAAHGEGVIHRDLKPANILLDDEDRVFITDFGIAQSGDAAELTLTGVVVGTPAYLAPEQLEGEPATAASDVFALGVLLYEMLTAELPPRDPRKTAVRLKTEQQVPRKLAAVIQRCLAPDPRQRFAGVGALLQALDGTTSGVALPWRPAALPGGWTWWMAALLLVLLAVGWLGRDFLFSPVQGPGPEQRWVVVLPFDNKTPDPQLDWMQEAAADLLIAELSPSEHLRVVSGERTLQTLADLKIDDYAFRGDEVKRLATIFDADYLLRGSLTGAGETLRLDLQLLDTLHPQEPQYLETSGPPGRFLALLSDLADQVRDRLQVRPQSRSPALAFTDSIESLEAFQRGAARFRRGDYQEAARLLEESIQADPRFLRAYLLQSRSYEFAGDHRQARAVLERAAAVSDASDSGGARRVRARLALLDGEIERSIQLLEQLVESHPDDPDLLFETALALEEAARWERAVQVLEEVVRLDPTHPRAHFHLGKDTILLGEAEEALGSHLVKALSISTQLDDPYGKADVLNAMGVAYERLGRYEEAIQHFRQSFELKEQVGNKQGAGTSLTNLANILIFQGRYGEAEEIMHRTLTLFQEIGDQRGVANVTNQFGVVNEDRGDLGRALEYYKEALQIRRRLGGDQKTAQSYDNVGYIYYLTGEYDNAEVYWRQALELKQTLGDERGVIISHQNMGFLQTAQGEVDAATKSFLEALERSRSIKLENGVAVSLGNLGSLYQMQGRYRAALESYGEANQILRGLDDKRGLAEYTKLLGSALLEVSDLEAAEAALEEASKLAAEIGSPELEVETLVLQAELRRAQGRLGEAGGHLDRALRIVSGQRELHKSLIRARIEEALLLSARGQGPAAARAAEEARRQAQRVGDARLELTAGYASARVEQDRGRAASALSLAESTLDRAQEMGVRPYLMRLHGVAGEAALALGRSQEAGRHFDEGAEQLREIERLSPAEHHSGLRQIPEVRTIESRLPTPTIAEKASRD